MGSTSRRTTPWWARGLALGLTAGVVLAWVLAAAGIGLAAGPGDGGTASVLSTPEAAAAAVETVRLLPGTEHETLMTVIRGPEEGPVVLAVGGVHGNDPAGVRAGQALAGLRNLQKGTLIVIPALNKLAVDAGRRSVDIDLNRAFPTTRGSAPTDPRARAVWDVMQQYGVDYLVDMHEDARRWTVSNDIGNVLIFRRVADNTAIARDMLNALNEGVSSTQRWRLGGEPISRGLVRSAEDLLGVHGFYVSTAASNAMDTRVQQHQNAVLTLLDRLGMLADDGGTTPPDDGGTTPPDDGGQDEDPAPAPGQVTVRTLLSGTRFETKLYIIDSGVPGPTVWISGGVHGSELAGWQAADQIKNWRVRRGRLIVLPHANALAVEQRRRAASGYGDLNREFPTTGDSTPDSQVASAIWAELRRYRPDWVFDLHEAMSNRNLNPSSVGQTMIVWPSSAMVSMAQAVIADLNRSLPSSQDFQMLRYPVNGSLARAAGQILGANAAIVETSRMYNLSTRINWHLTLMRSVLQRLNMDPVIQQSSLQPTLSAARVA